MLAKDQWETQFDDVLTQSPPPVTALLTPAAGAAAKPANRRQAAKDPGFIKIANCDNWIECAFPNPSGAEAYRDSLGLQPQTPRMQISRR